MTQHHEVQGRESRRLTARNWADLCRSACELFAYRLQVIGALCLVGAAGERTEQYSPIGRAVAHQGYDPAALVKSGVITGGAGLAVEAWSRYRSAVQAKQRTGVQQAPLHPQPEAPWGSTLLMAHWQTVQEVLADERPPTEPWGSTYLMAYWESWQPIVAAEALQTTAA